AAQVMQLLLRVLQITLHHAVAGQPAQQAEAARRGQTDAAEASAVQAAGDAGQTETDGQCAFETLDVVHGDSPVGVEVATRRLRGPFALPDEWPARRRLGENGRRFVRRSPCPLSSSRPCASPATCWCSPVPAFPP